MKIAALMLMLASGALRAFDAAEPVDIAGVDNLYRVSPTLYRSAMPEAEGFRALEDSEIASVLSLRWKADPADDTPDDGPRRLHIPIRTWDLEEEHVVEFLRLATDPANQPMLVHCRHGADRTGTMIAAYRVAVQGWSKQQALDEMKTDRYRHHWLWVNLRRFVRDMDVERIRAAAGIEAPRSVETAAP
jgi:protein tyrosine phosphatase (PTP) superfamily phosphohydrolase (DUF442 family)